MNFREAEVRGFWLTVSELKQAERDEDYELVAQIRDEIRGIMVTTEDVSIRHRCRTLLEDHHLELARSW